MSPQVISGEGYGKDADWWAVGVVMFECLDGLTPFVEDDDDDADPYRTQMRIFNNILSKPVVYQPNVTSHARKLIGQLLERNVTKRLADRQAIRSSAFFRHNGMNWDQLEVRLLSIYSYAYECRSRPRSPFV
jgi:serine/threonine protein kinase|tara:strand:- start:784 stop:1179 length:396 start_codon:yes stop_codon:yes gene_type:complete